MPEKLLDDLDEQQIRDLFAYLQSSGPVPASAGQERPPTAAAKEQKAIVNVCLVSGALEYKSDESLA